MRIVDDLAIRARNWFWYWRVRDISGLSDDALDRKCFGETVRRKRHFESVRKSASAPNEVPLIDGKYLLQIVDLWGASEGEAGPFSAATHDFSSSFWEMLYVRDVEPNFYTDFIQRYAQKQGWFRMRFADRDFYATFLGESEPAIQPGIETAYSAMLHKLVNEGTLEALAVLTALFREAMFHVLLEQAMAIRTALNLCISRMFDRIAMPEEMRRLIYQLTHDRVLSNVWLTESDWRERTGTVRKSKSSSRDRIKEFSAWVGWYLSKDRGVSSDFGYLPLVPGSARIDWMDVNRAALREVYDHVTMLRDECSTFKDSCIPGALEYAEAARIERARILDEFKPPSDKPVRFYEERPNWVMGMLPTPY